MPSNADLLAIKNELTHDPADIGLTVLAADDEANADKLNLSRATIRVDRSYVSVSEIDFDRDEYAGLSPADRAWLDLVTRSGAVKPASIRNDLNKAFGANTATRASYEAAFTQQASRIQQMAALGIVAVSYVTPSDIANARNAT